MSFEGYRDREIRQLQERISRLEHENSALKSHSCFQQPHLPAHVPIDPYANSIYGKFPFYPRTDSQERKTLARSRDLSEINKTRTD